MPSNLTTDQLELITEALEARQRKEPYGRDEVSYLIADKFDLTADEVDAVVANEPTREGDVYRLAMHFQSERWKAEREAEEAALAAKEAERVAGLSTWDEAKEAAERVLRRQRAL